MSLPEREASPGPVPPAYTEHIGGYLLAEVERRATDHKGAQQ